MNLDWIAPTLLIDSSLLGAGELFFSLLMLLSQSRREITHVTVLIGLVIKILQANVRSWFALTSVWPPPPPPPPPQPPPPPCPPWPWSPLSNASSSNDEEDERTCSWHQIITCMLYPDLLGPHCFHKYRYPMLIFAKDCLQTLVKSRLAQGSPGWLFGCHHAKNGWTHRKIAVDSAQYSPVHRSKAQYSSVQPSTQQ